MAKPTSYDSTVFERQRRFFSESFKQKKVREIERNLSTVLQVCKEYGV